jgi:hypothetical protein
VVLRSRNLIAAELFLAQATWIGYVLHIFIGQCLLSQIRARFFITAVCGRVKKILLIFIGFSKVFLIILKLGDVVFSHQGVHFFPLASGVVFFSCIVDFVADIVV